MRTFSPFDEHHPDFFAVVHQRPRETNFTGQEQSIVEQTYFAEDEPTFDTNPELDAIALQNWRDREVFIDSLPI